MAVNRVSHNGIPDVGKMNPDLMGSSCFRRNREEREETRQVLLFLHNVFATLPFEGWTDISFLLTGWRPMGRWISPFCSLTIP